AVLAGSFERIHRSNLIGMGVVPLLVPEHAKAKLQQVRVEDLIEISVQPAAITVRAMVPVKVKFYGGRILEFEACLAAETELDLALLRAGGVIPHLLAKTQAQFQGAVR
ncbi:hypothetical protein BZG21_40035, partial [Escherichia coli]|nr:hypothetical protein [Escherichia coli]